LTGPNIFLSISPSHTAKVLLSLVFIVQISEFFLTCPPYEYLWHDRNTLGFAILEYINILGNMPIDLTKTASKTSNKGSHTTEVGG